jgi:hypothetical protein
VRFDQAAHRTAVAPGVGARHQTKWRLTIAQLDVVPAGSDAERILIWARAILADIADLGYRGRGDHPARRETNGR